MAHDKMSAIEKAFRKSIDDKQKQLDAWKTGRFSCYEHTLNGEMIDTTKQYIEQLQDDIDELKGVLRDNGVLVD